MSGRSAEWLAECRAPVLLAVGDEDRLADRRGLAELAAGHPHVRLRIVPGADHQLPLVAPAACVELIRSLAN
ncbi:MAG TPA: alpha/beta hydrolase, partial [Candidatus Acidoferrales bacterium]|nr:alpha/beta hydrolase [Candidatus Acidoferrales bacterium]